MNRSEFDSLDKRPLEKRGVKFCYRLGSPTSQGFVVGADRIERREFLKNAFDIKNQSKFDEKYDEASTGSGQPYKDFDALRSSALCALLSFYNIEDLVIDGDCYDKAYFEVQNTVIVGRNPSNMDVVLVSKDNKTILFLECKFSEYKSNAKQDISNAYLDECDLSKDLYSILVKSGLATIEKGEKMFVFKTPEAYSQGTKQVISHLVGITSFINRKKDYEKSFAFYGESDGRRELYTTWFENVKFQEVLFELKGYEAKLDAYQKLSEKVRKLFIESGLINRIKFLPATTYQKLFKNQKGKNVDDIVFDYYKY